MARRRKGIGMSSEWCDECSALTQGPWTDCVYLQALENGESDVLWKRFHCAMRAALVATFGELTIVADERAPERPSGPPARLKRDVAALGRRRHPRQR